MKTQSILPAFLLLFSCFFAEAQQRSPEARKEKIETLKVGYITQQLSLTTEEAQKFWPIYNQYQQELKELRKQRRNERGADKKIEEMTDKEAESLIDGHINFEQKQLDLKKKYSAQFKQVLPVKKVVLLYKAERDFKRVLMQKAREHRGAQPQNKR